MLRMLCLFFFLFFFASNGAINLLPTESPIIHVHIIYVQSYMKSNVESAKVKDSTTLVFYQFKIVLGAECVGGGEGFWVGRVG